MSVAPPADKELQSAIDASFAHFVLTDIDMICSFMAEDDLTPDFYMPAPGEDISKITVVRNPLTYQCVVGYNSVKCMDGKLRAGSIFLYNNNSNPNAKYYRNYEFKGKVVFQSYMVDGWKIQQHPGDSLRIYNLLSSPVLNPSTTKLSWMIEGSLQFLHPTDPSRNMTWSGKIIKTLANTSDPLVYNAGGQQSINWSKAVVEYRGEVSGVTEGNREYTLQINDVKPMVRDFTCYPNAVSGIESVQPLKTWASEYHPFKSGIATFIPGNRYPRQVYYGNEGNPSLPAQCDNSGEILIKGNTYRVDFMN
jgi:hypothetical protein